MTKRTIARWWIGGVLAMVPAGILIPSASLALAAHNKGVSDAYSRMMVALIVLGGFFLVGSLVLQLVAWIYAVLNTRIRADARWFKALLWGGIASLVTMPLFGLGALVLVNLMIAYLVAGPERVALDARPTTPPKATIRKWAWWGFVGSGAGMSLAMLVLNVTNGRGWPALALASLGFTVAAAGIIVVCAAWWGALFNAHTLADKTWFKRLLWSGITAAVTMPLFGIGVLILLAVLIAYSRSAPDGTTGQPPASPTLYAPPASLVTPR